MLREMRKIKSGKKEIREFAFIVGGLLILISTIAMWRGKPHPYIFSCGIVMVICGIISPLLLKPLQKAWMAIAIVVGFFMSRIILAISYYLVVTPMGLLTKAMGKDILDEKLDASAKTYWKARDSKPKEKISYEQQF